MMLVKAICMMCVATVGLAHTAQASLSRHPGIARGDAAPSTVYAEDKRKEKIKKGNCKITRKWKGDTFTEKKKCKGGSNPV